MFLKLRKFYRKTPVLQSLFNKAAGLRVSYFIRKTLQHRCFSVKFENFLRIHILRTFCERLPLRVLANQRHIQNPVNDLRWNLLRKIFQPSTKSSIWWDAWLSSGYAFGTIQQNLQIIIICWTKVLKIQRLVFFNTSCAIQHIRKTLILGANLLTEC